MIKISLLCKVSIGTGVLDVKGILNTRTAGYLLQGRYKSILYEKEAYLLALPRYIQRNPLRAKIIDRLDRILGAAITHIPAGPTP